MIRYLFGRIAALWRPAAIAPRPRRGRAGEIGGAARDEETMGPHQPALRASPDDLLISAMASLGIDGNRLAVHGSPWFAEMRRACRTCDARSRCRRDLATGDFARRYRHYCANADSLALLAAPKLPPRPAPDRTRH